MGRLPRIRFARYNSAALSGAPAGGRRHFQPVMAADMADGGRLHVYGTTTLAAGGVPVSCKVRLFDRHNGRLIRETVSGEDGAYAFEFIRAGEYFVLAHDPSGHYNAVIADSVTAEVMP